ncbi:hypothetical protein [Hahella chejuensis]|uniref:hypothetical protein n=1 Tax=Hahella chejuensis TaxID=158327 RepID=UPI0005A14B2D|nr:hypothetical protein [Hahella chejuensis]
MRWLRRLKASKLNPMGPDFSAAPWVEFNLSGKKLCFRCPPHELSGPSEIKPETVNIYQDDIYLKWEKGKTGMSVDLVHTGWKFLDKPFGDGAIGYVTLYVRLQRRDPHYRKIDSLLNHNDIKEWIITYSDNVWGYTNRELIAHPERQARPIDPERDFWRYPQNKKDIHTMSKNDVDWFYYSVDKPNKAKRRFWHTPLSEDHELAFIFNSSSISRDYYEEDHDLDGAVERTVHEFIENVHIKLD